MLAHDLDHEALKIVFVEANDLKGKDKREF
jgi:hypothetical protein